MPTLTNAQVPTYQDCLGATPICLNSYSTASIITGTGNIPNEINPVNSCLLIGERNDAWYIVTTSTAGNLNMSIIPNNPAHNYDWAVYNLTTAICSDIFTNPSLEVACNFSNLPGVTGPNGLAGAQNNPVITVSAGQTYLINVSGFSSINQSGYTIDLSNSTASITDNTPPVLTGLTAVNCGASAMLATFSERVLCSSVQPTDFTLTGPGGPYTVSSISSTACSAGADYARDYSISFSPALTAAGAYTLSLTGVVTDLCSNNATVPQAFPFSISGVNVSFQKVDVTCFGGNNGSATAVVTGPPGPYTYQWSPSGGTGPTAQWLIAGTYTVTVTSAAGCTGQGSVTITQPLTGITASVTTTPANGCASNGTATVVVSNGQAPFTYSWWPTGGNASTATNLGAGSYMVTITDANQCVLNYFFTVPSSSGPTINISNFNGVSCFGGNDGSATVAVTGATGPFTYLWSPSGGTSATATGLIAGNYSVVVTVAPGCTLTASVSIVQPPTAVDVQVSSSHTSCGNNNGSISLNVNGGTGTYSYQWSPNVSSGNNAANLAAGTYTVTVSDGNGCSKVNTVVVNPSSMPVISGVNHQDVSCYGLSDGSTGISVLGGAAPLSYLWSSGQTSPLLNNISAGNYQVTVTDAAGCTSSWSDIVTQPSQVTIAITQVQHINCFGQLTGSASVSTSGGSGGNTWSWQGVVSNTSSISNVGSGTYTATVSDQNGCSSSVQVIINQPAAPLALTDSIVPTTCGNSDGKVFSDVNGGTAPYSYLWNTGSTASGITSLVSGVYTLTVTDHNGCVESITATLQASDAPVISVTSITDVTCNGGNNGSAVLSVTGGESPYTWLWQGNNSTGNSASGLQAASYLVTVTDASGCQSFQQVVITQPEQLVVQLSPAATICTGQNTTITGTTSGGTQPYTYLWNTGSASIQVTVSPVISTSYMLTVTDRNGCISTSSPMSITVLPPLSLAITGPDSVCKGDVAEIQLQPSGGDQNYSYSWNNGLSGTSNAITITNDSSFTVTLSDGCSTAPVAATMNITAIVPPVVNMTLPLQTGCEPFEAQFAVPQTWPPSYNYLWNFGDGFTSAQPVTSHTYLQHGIYQVTLSVAYPAAAGCASQLQFPNAVNVKAVPVARFIFDPSAPTLNHPEVFFSDRSTNAAYWSWTFGDQSTEIREQNPHHTYKDTGTYFVKLKVQSQEGCFDSTYNVVEVEDELQVFIPNAFTPDASGVNDYFKIYGVGFTSYELFIFDRWGKLVHTTKNSEKAWDGNDDGTGNPVPPGLYVYKVSITDNAGNIHNRYNHVTVIR